MAYRRGGGGSAGGSIGTNQIIITLGIFISGILVIAMAPAFAGYCSAAATDANISGTVAAILYDPVMPILWGIVGVACIVGPIWRLFKAK
jgi:hypothetical protein